MHTPLSPKHNYWYEELCALAAIGEVSSSEFEELQAHLTECGECRELYADFRRISAEELGQVAVLRGSEQLSEEVGDGVDEHGLLARLLDRAQLERSAGRSSGAADAILTQQWSKWTSLARIVDWLRRPALSYATVGLLLCAVAAIGAYRLRDAQLSPTLAKLHSEMNEERNRAHAIAAEQERTAQLLARSQAERDALRKFLQEAQTKYAELQTQRKSLEAELTAGRSQMDQHARELESAKAIETEKSKEITALEERVRNAVDRTDEQRRISENLQVRLDRMQQQAANTPEAQGFGDVEAKKLFGARDLHIVDVYDVDAKGATRRTFGRVYYVEKNLLIFYAFDLENKKPNRGPASFQAWGYRQANESKSESLGLFSMDDPSVNRWVLKVNSQRVIERIDAVFVTAEAPHGSPFPTGRKLLYANLAGPANHP